MWIDSDCIVMKELAATLQLLRTHEFVAHRERSGLISNGFLAASPGSRLASNFYRRICAVLRSGTALHWTAIGSEPLTTTITEDSRGWYELPCQHIQPVCWSTPGEFFVEREPGQHLSALDSQAICYMLSNTSIREYTTAHGECDLLAGSSFFSYLVGKSLGISHDELVGGSETIFSSHREQFRQQCLESLSGPGSSSAQTGELRRFLPRLLERLGVRSILDVGCGDFNWLRQVALPDIDYLGIDVDSEIVAENEWRYAGERLAFRRADILCEELPAADVILCRDVLTHLSFENIYRTIRNFLASGSGYLLTTTFTGSRRNRDTRDGTWRTLSLTRPPFCFPPPLRILPENCTEDGGLYHDKSLAVWHLASIAACICEGPN
jgi:SAM-dependent methyltransferase